MIRFGKIRYKNLLSTGNDFTEIDLDRDGTSTLIVGRNGAGKSSVLDALSFGLFGKPFRDINKPQLVNTIIGKQLLVEIEFSIQNKHYMVRRGIKPTVFEVYCDGILKDQESKDLDYQADLETNILKLDYKSFKQIVVLGSRNYVPFMQLKTNERRNMIESLLDIQIFSVMNLLLRDRVSTNKQKLNELDIEIESTNQKIDIVDKHIEKINTNIQTLVDKKQFTIDQFENDIINAKTNISQLTDELNQLGHPNTSLNIARARLAKIDHLVSTLDQRKKNVDKSISFFEQHNNCPTCKQQIDDHFKNKTLSQKKMLIEQLDLGLNTVIEKQDSGQKQVDHYLSLVNQHNQLQSSINQQTTQIETLTQFIQLAKNEIESIKATDHSSSDQIASKEDMEKMLGELEIAKKTQLETRQLLEISSVLLKDGGIKTKIVRQFVPIINKLINKYLAQMEFFVDFSLDDQFNETIKSRFRDTFSYNSFSEGEKMRIDLAVLFAWRAIAKMRNSMSTNILILDEIFDSSLDGDGTEEFLRIVKELAGSINVFIISHKSDGIVDKFDSVIEFQKHKSFSKASFG